MKPYDILIAAYWRSYQANKFAVLAVAENVMFGRRRSSSMSFYDRHGASESVMNGCSLHKTYYVALRTKPLINLIHQALSEPQVLQTTHHQLGIYPRDTNNTV